MRNVIAYAAGRAANRAQPGLLDADDDARQQRRRAGIATRTHQILADRHWNERLIRALLETEGGRAALWNVRRANANNLVSAMHRLQDLLTKAAEQFAVDEADAQAGGP